MDSRAQIRDATEDWVGVTDDRERKRLQNRLAQRARRAKKLRENRPVPRPGSVARVSDSGQLGSGETSPSVELAIIHSAPGTQSGARLEASLGSSQLDWSPPLQDLGLVSYQSAIASSSSELDFQSMLPSPYSLVLNAMPAVEAYATDFNILQLRCDGRLILSSPPCPSTPRSLAATSLQMSIPHKIYVDILPFPSMRDRILNALCIIDEDDLCNDMMQEQIRCWGNFPWNRNGWELPASFVDKWWFLMDEDVVDFTNFWRRERGDPELVWRGRKLIHS